MTTPAGWYDDGSGRQRWWDGTQWTEHFAPLTAPESSAADEAPAEEAAVESTPRDHDSDSHRDAAATSAPESAAAAETAASIESVSAVEGASWNAPASDDATPTAEAPAAEVADSQPADPWAAPEAQAADPAQSPQTGTSQYEGFNSPEAAAPSTQSESDVPPYASPAPSYPAAAPSYPGATAQQQYPTAPAYSAPAPGYPGASGHAPAGQAYGAPGGYPPAYGAQAPAAPAGLSILGLVGLGLAALGTILSCIPVIFWLGWLLLGAGFIVSLISLFLKGKKWPGISGLILSVVGAVIAVVMFFVIVFATVSEVVRDLPTAPPSSDSDTDNGTDPGTDEGTDPTDVVEGELGSPITVEQMSGTSEVTINSATWATTDGSSIPSTNGGYVPLDITFTGISGTSYINPFYVMIETAEGTEGDYDYYVDGIVAEELAAGETVSGTMTFDIAQSESYEVIFTDELLQEVARVAITASAG